jgi:hypothetical protein
VDCDRPSSKARRIVSELDVVAVVAERGAALGKVDEVGLVLLVEQRILRGKPIRYWLWVCAKREAVIVRTNRLRRSRVVMEGIKKDYPVARENGRGVKMRTLVRPS